MIIIVNYAWNIKLFIRFIIKNRLYDYNINRYKRRPFSKSFSYIIFKIINYYKV
jgi:hypothetical protein